MERDCDVCLFTVVSRSKFKSLLMSRKYERRNRGVLICLEKLPDGRESFIILDKEWARWEKCEREVLAEIDKVSDDTPIVIEQPIPTSPQSKHDDGIPDADKQEAFKLGLGENQPLPNHPEGSRRPSWFRGGFDPFGGR